MLQVTKVQWVHRVFRESPDSKDTRVQLDKLAQWAQQVPPVKQDLEAKLATRGHKDTLVQVEVSAELADKDWVGQLV